MFPTADISAAGASAPHRKIMRGLFGNSEPILWLPAVALWILTIPLVFFYARSLVRPITARVVACVLALFCVVRCLASQVEQEVDRSIVRL